MSFRPSLVRALYSLLTRLLRPIAMAGVLWRGLRDRAYWDGLGERFGWGDRVAGESIWVHAVSLGEVTAAAPLVQALCARHPGVRLVITTATPTGRARARALFGPAVDVRFLPYDTPGAMRRFLLRVRPRVAVIMETELWPNLFHECRRRGVAVVLANARLSARSVARYRRFGPLFRDVFSGPVLVAAQSDVDAARFIAIGAPPARTCVVGNLKFDVAAPDAALERGRRLRTSFAPARPVWIAGSTHAGEDEAVLTAHAAVRARTPQALLLLVPRHPERFAAVAQLLEQRGFSFARRSRQAAAGTAADGSAATAQIDVLLVDTLGELAALYAAADVAFVGGSLVPVGGHNLLEPAALGVPVVAGPYQSNARDVVRRLEQAGALLQVADAADLAAAVSGLLHDAERRRAVGAAGRAVVEENRGSLGRLLDLIEPLLAADRSPEAALSAAS